MAAMDIQISTWYCISGWLGLDSSAIENNHQGGICGHGICGLTLAAHYDTISGNLGMESMELRTVPLLTIASFLEIKAQLQKHGPG